MGEEQFPNGRLRGDQSILDILSELDVPEEVLSERDHIEHGDLYEVLRSLNDSTQGEPHHYYAHGVNVCSRYRTII